MFEDSAGKGFDFGEADGLPAKRFPSYGRGLHAGAYGKETHRDLRSVVRLSHGLVLGALVGQRGGDELVLGAGDGEGLVDVPQGSSPAFLIGAYGAALGARVVATATNLERDGLQVSTC